MKKFVFFAIISVVLVSSLSSCGNRSSQAPQSDIDSLVQVMRADREFREKYQMITALPETETVKIHFKEGESPFFDVYTLTRESEAVDVAFFRAEDVTTDGRIKKGKRLVRTFMIFIPTGEKLKNWGHGGIDLTRPDGTIHHISFTLVNQPK